MFGRAWYLPGPRTCPLHGFPEAPSVHNEETPGCMKAWPDFARPPFMTIFNISVKDSQTPDNPLLRTGPAEFAHRASEHARAREQRITGQGRRRIRTGWNQKYDGGDTGGDQALRDFFTASRLLFARVFFAA